MSKRKRTESNVTLSKKQRLAGKTYSRKSIISIHHLIVLGTPNIHIRIPSPTKSESLNNTISNTKKKSTFKEISYTNGIPFQVRSILIKINVSLKKQMFCIHVVMGLKLL